MAKPLHFDLEDLELESHFWKVNSERQTKLHTYYVQVETISHGSDKEKCKLLLTKNVISLVISGVSKTNKTKTNRF